MWHLETLTSNIDTRITGTKFEYIFQDFIGNSALYPLAIIILQLMMMPAVNAVLMFHFLGMLAGAALQAWYLGSRDFEKRPQPMRGNLIAVTICTAFSLVADGPWATFGDAKVEIFWAYSLTIGLAQELRVRVRFKHLQHLLILAEHLIRACVLIALFGLFHLLYDPEIKTWQAFIERTDHIYVMILILLFATLIGMASINAHRYLHTLRETAMELRQYSEWLLGSDLLQQSVRNPTILNLQRQERTVVFMDIRGFTAWSSANSPEVVVALINHFYQTAEQVLVRFQAIKVELTGDEILAVFRIPEAAVAAALAATEAVKPVLAKVGLDVGVGINAGPVIEGLVGGASLKKFGVMGDTVNAGKRICSAASRGEILLSRSMYQAVHKGILVGDMRQISVKGITDPLHVVPLRGLRYEAEVAEIPLASLTEATQNC